MSILRFLVQRKSIALEKLFELGLFHEAIRGRLYRTLEEEPSNENYMAALEARVILREALSLILNPKTWMRWFILPWVKYLFSLVNSRPVVTALWQRTPGCQPCQCQLVLQKLVFPLVSNF